jgi:hypothetical protein
MEFRLGKRPDLGVAIQGDARSGYGAVPDFESDDGVCRPRSKPWRFNREMERAGLLELA